MILKLCGLIFLSFLASCRSSDSEQNNELDGLGKAAPASNYSGSVVCQPGTLITADSVQRIQDAIRWAQRSKKDLRTWSLAAPRSYSPVICPTDGGVLLNLSPLNRLLSVDKDNQTAIVQPGILINELNDQLHEQGFTFPVTPDYNGISIAGGMATGAHHSSLKIPTAIADWIEEIKLVDGTGAVRTLTGAQLDTARVHLGLLGVIYELKIRIVPQHKIKYGLENLSDATLEQDIVAAVRQHDYARVMWFPSQKSYVLDHFNKVPLDTEGDSYNNIWSSTPNISWLGDVPVGTLNASQAIQCTAEAVRAKTFAGSFVVSRSDRKSPVGLSHKMIAATCEPGKCSWDYGIKTRTVEVGMPLARLPEWIADVRSIMAKRKGCFPILGIYLRFSAPSRSALGQASNQETFVFEIHVPQTSKPSLEPSSDAYDEMVQMSLAKYKGRPHWGKNSLPYFLNLGPEQFPEWEKFEALRAELDPSGTFENAFWKQVKSQARVAQAPDCAVSKVCICTQDSDCGKGATCEAGGFFTEARVCRR